MQFTEKKAKTVNMMKSSIKYKLDPNLLFMQKN